MLKTWKKALDILPFEASDKERLYVLLQHTPAMAEANAIQMRQRRWQKRLTWLSALLVLALGSGFGGWEWLWPLPLLTYLALGVPKRHSKKEVATHLILVAALRIYNYPLSKRYLRAVRPLYQEWPNQRQLRTLLKTILEWSQEKP